MSLSRRGQHCSQNLARTGRVLAPRAPAPVALLTVPAAALAVLVALLTALAGTANGAPVTKAVTYRGYTMHVPASWPVYRLTPRSTACVRFNRHALYLGSPGARQRCPANPAGRTEAILAAPLRAATATKQPAASPALPAVTVRGAQPAGGSETRVTIPARGVQLTATWKRHPGVVRRALRVKLSHRGLGVKLGYGSAVGKTARATRSANIARALGPRPGAKGSSAPRTTGTLFTGLGFDPCSAPTPAQMTAWGASPYRAIGVYIGGTNMACSQVNLTSTWVATEWAAGWHLIPTYVGLQAPGNSCGCSAIVAGQATAEGAAAAVDAVAHAQALGIGPGNPIYDDMEAYSAGPAVSPAVLAFLAGWTDQLHAEGYGAGVYSSSASGIVDLAAQYGTGYAEPDDIWIANWNGVKSTVDPAVPSIDWSAHQRLHQYRGGHNETYGGVTINIDNDYLDGATAFGAGTAVTVPAGQPSLRVSTAGDGTIRLSASWPGGAGVTAWRALGGASPATLAPIGQKRGSASTTITAHSAFPFYAVQALGSAGQVLAASPTVATGRHLALWGRSIFVPPRGLIGVPAGCFTGATCRIALTITAGRRMIARTGRERLASSAGLVYFQMSSAQRSLLARTRGRRLAVKVQARDVSGTAASRSMTLVPFSISGAGPRRSSDPAQTLRVIASRALVSSSGFGGVLAGCMGAAPCPARTKITAGRRTIASTRVETIGANEARYESFKLSPAGRRLLARARGNQLAARATISAGSTIEHAQVVLSSFS